MQNTSEQVLDIIKISVIVIHLYHLPQVPFDR